MEKILLLQFSLWWCYNQKDCSSLIKIIDLPLCSLKSFSKISNNEAYDFEESTLKNKINDTLGTKDYEHDFYYYGVLIKNIVLVESKQMHLPLCFFILSKNDLTVKLINSNYQEVKEIYMKQLKQNIMSTIFIMMVYR